MERRGSACDGCMEEQTAGYVVNRIGSSVAACKNIVAEKRKNIQNPFGRWMLRCSGFKQSLAAAGFLYGEGVEILRKMAGERDDGEGRNRDCGLAFRRQPQGRDRYEACDKAPEESQKEVVGLSRELAVLVENLEKALAGKMRNEERQKLAHDGLLSVEEKLHTSIIPQTKEANTKRDGQGIRGCRTCLFLQESKENLFQNILLDFLFEVLDAIDIEI